MAKKKEKKPVNTGGDKTIKVTNPNDLPTISYKRLKDFQGDFKVISPASLAKLKQSIISLGFVVPKFVWVKGKNHFVLDGHQTKKALASLESDGWAIPDIPFVKVEAKNKTEAGKILLQLNSRYGDINPNTNFFSDFKIDIDFLNDIEIPEIIGVAEEIELPKEEFAKEDFTEVIDTFVEAAPPPPPGNEQATAKNANWFYVEFYQDDERFKEVLEIFKENMRTPHEIEPEFFYTFAKRMAAK